MYTQVTIASSGRLTVPSVARHKLGLHGGEKLDLRVVDGALVFETQDAAIRRIRSIMRNCIPEGVSLVDELIADRRAAPENE